MSRRGSASVPPGYERGSVGSIEVVALESSLSAVLAVVRQTPLYVYAAAHPSARVMHGRAPVYAAPLPDGGPTVVVRRSRHGGMLAPITGDRFLGSTRAPSELVMSVQLAALGIATPRVAATVVYPAGPLFRRSDVATLFIDASADLASILSDESRLVSRAAAIDAAAELLAGMARSGVRHPDLNLKNILVVRATAGSARAYLLDIDRVRIEASRAPAAARNAARLVRSANKWRVRHGAPVTDAEVEALEAAALGRAP